MVHDASAAYRVALLPWGSALGRFPCSSVSNSAQITCVPLGGGRGARSQLLGSETGYGATTGGGGGAYFDSFCVASWLDRSSVSCRCFELFACCAVACEMGAFSAPCMHHTLAGSLTFPKRDSLLRYLFSGEYKKVGQGGGLSPSLSADGGWLPFDFDGRCACVAAIPASLLFCVPASFLGFGWVVFDAAPCASGVRRLLRGVCLSRSLAAQPPLSCPAFTAAVFLSRSVFKARSDPFPHTAQFTRVFIALLGTPRSPSAYLALALSGPSRFIVIHVPTL